MSDQPPKSEETHIHEPFSIEDVPWETFQKGDRFKVNYRSLGDHGGGSHLGVSYETLEPGKQAYPAHYHYLEEEHLMILKGSLTLRLGQKTYEMKEGDYVCFPAGQKAGHAILNKGTQPCTYLMIGERNPSEVSVYTDTGRIGVRLTQQGYHKDANMDYWEGEDI